MLALVGVVAGAINAAAGGGSLVSFPALVAIGYPPLTANVTNNVAVAPGYVTGAVGYRRGLSGQRRRIVPLAITSAVGSLIGVALISRRGGEASDRRGRICESPIDPERKECAATLREDPGWCRTQT